MPATRTSPISPANAPRLSQPLHRRDWLQLGGAALVASAVPQAFARAPMAGSQVISVHRMKLGEFEVTTILDGFIDADPKLLSAPQEAVKNMLEAAKLPYGPVRLPVNTFLVNTGDKLVLIDTGGAKLIGPNAGRLTQGLAAAGIEPGQIDEVLITHMHGDHLHGAVTPEGTALFPNATLRISQPDVDYWTSAEVEAKAPPEQKGRFVAAKRAKAAYGERLKPFALGAELVPGIQSIAAVGHTPGHTCYMVTSGTARMLAIGDLIHIAPVQLPRPDVTIAFDWEQPTARGARMNMFDLAAKEDILIAAVHLPFPGLGHLRKDGGSYAYTPLSWRLF
jgi:glyoxylase-like metal-dependent hydrolase (beta-lactamase superfamily II)